MKWKKVQIKLPPPFVRVLTYSPQYRDGAKNCPERGVTILLYDDTPETEQDYPGNRGWVDDNGERAMFDPTYWRFLPPVEL